MNSSSTTPIPETDTTKVDRSDSLVVGQYRLISRLSDQLVAHAHAGDWDSTAETLNEYKAAVDTLAQLGAPHQADATTCRTLIGRILQNDARLRELVEPERNRLNLEMGNLKRQTTVLTAYSAPVLTHER